MFEIAEHQYGVVSRAQLLAAGVTTKQVERWVTLGRLERTFPGVYRVPGSVRSDRQLAMAACVWLGSEAAVSHLAAATLLRLDGCRTSDLDVSIPNKVRRRSRSDLVRVHRVSRLPREDRVMVDGIRCTSASRTLVDCATVLDEEALEVAFESARRMGLASVRSLAERAAPVLERSRPGASALRRLLEHQRPGERALQYRLEVKAARLLRSSRLPRPNRQVAVGPYFIDFGFDSLVGVECEGFDYHGNRLAWKRDKRRTSWIEAQGWRLVFVSWDDVIARPDETIHRIALALESHSPPVCEGKRLSSPAAQR